MKQQISTGIKKECILSEPNLPTFCILFLGILLGNPVLYAQKWNSPFFTLTAKLTTIYSLSSSYYPLFFIFCIKKQGQKINLSSVPCLSPYLLAIFYLFNKISSSIYNCYDNSRKSFIVFLLQSIHTGNHPD